LDREVEVQIKLCKEKLLKITQTNLLTVRTWKLTGCISKQDFDKNHKLFFKSQMEGYSRLLCYR